MVGQAPAAPGVNLDIDTREKCQFFLGALVQQGRNIIYGVTDEGPSSVLPGFLVNAGDVFGLLQHWVPGQAGTDPSPLADYDVASSSEMLVAQAEKLVTIFEAQTQIEVARMWIHHLQQGVACLRGVLGQPGTDEEQEALNMQVAHGELDLLMRFRSKYLELDEPNHATQLSNHAKAIFLQSALDWFERSFARRRPDLIPPEDRSRGRDPERMMNDCIQNIGQKAARLHGAVPDSPDEVLHDISQELQRVAQYLNIFIEDPEFSEAASSAGASRRTGTTATTTSGSALTLPASAGPTQVSTEVFRHPLRVDDAIPEGDEADEELLEGHSAFHQAAMEGVIERVKALLTEAPADLNKPDGFGDTPLMLAAFNGHEAVVELLCSQAECDVFARNGQGLTARDQAYRKGYHDLGRILAQEEFSNRRLAQRKDYGGTVAQTSLQEAIELEHAEEAAALVTEAAAQHQEDPDWGKALRIAIQKGKLDMVNFFLDKGAELSKADIFGQTPLLQASTYGHLDVVELLLVKGADLHKADEGGRTALMQASRLGHWTVAQLLIEKGADVSKADIHGQTSLHWASEEGHLDVVELLLVKGADLHKADEEGRTALIKAARNGHQAVVEHLVEKGAELHTADKKGQTALTEALAGEHLDVVELLLGKGSDSKSKDEDGTTPLMLAREGEDRWVREGDEGLAKRWRDIIECLVAQGAHLNEKDKHGRTVLMQACYYGQLEVVKILAAAEGSQLEAKDDDGNTLLMLARSGEASKAKAQAEAAAKLEGFDRDRNPYRAQAIEWCLKEAETHRKGCRDIIEYLSTQGIVE